MKFLTKVLLLFFCTIQLAFAASIVIDAGHGGRDPGANRRLNGILYLEKNLTLNISRRLAGEFEARGQDVVMTRNSDIFLDKSSRLAKGRQFCKNAFISVHVDANPFLRSKIKGATIYVHRTANARNRKIAAAAQRALNPKRLYRTAGYTVLRPKKPSCASMLVETGYINNEDDLKQLIKPSYQREISSKLAQSVTDSLSKYKN